MGTKLYVSNLSYNTSEDELREFFSSVGEVVSVRIITDPYSGRSRGFGFVEMASEEEAKAAIDSLDRSELGGRHILVSPARERPQTKRRY
ncbi:MAG: RNA-binding protein [Methanobacteriota archaeon]|nr:MAG: RNA-binding protein [Euryarchaeota archaeon]